MATLQIHTFDLRLQHTFRIAHGARDVQPTLIVALHDKGLTGYGEATATSYYGLTIDGMRQELEKVRPLVEAAEWEMPQDFYDIITPALPTATAVRCALDVAAHDLWGKRHSQPLYQLWGLPPRMAPPTSYTIGLGSIEEMVNKMKEKPWPVYKIKLGTDEDLRIIESLRQHTTAIFRVDANTGWTAEQTVRLSKQLASLGVEFIEQPLPADDWEGHQYVYQKSALPIIADESLQTPDEVVRCSQCFHGINIKLLKCGGLTPARDMIRTAKSLGLRTMIGCMTESSVGISAIAQLAPLLDYVDIDGALLLSNDPAEGITITPSGHIQYSERGGTGARLRE